MIYRASVQEIPILHFCGGGVAKSQTQLRDGTELSKEYLNNRIYENTVFNGINSTNYE